MAESVLAQFPLTVASQLVQQTSVQIEQQKEAAVDAAKEAEGKRSTSALQVSAPVSEASENSDDSESDTNADSGGSFPDGRGKQVNIQT